MVTLPWLRTLGHLCTTGQAQVLSQWTWAGVGKDGWVWRAMTEWTDDLVHLSSLCPTPTWKKANTAFHSEQSLKFLFQSLHTFCLELPSPFSFDINWWHIWICIFPTWVFLFLATILFSVIYFLSWSFFFKNKLMPKLIYIFLQTTDTFL